MVQVQKRSVVRSLKLFVKRLLVNSDVQPSLEIITPENNDQ